MGAMRWIEILVATACVALLSGCSSVRVTSDFDPNANFSALQGYAWLAASQPPTGDPRLDNTLLDARIRNAIEAELGKRGHRKVAPAAADFLVAYYVAVESKVDVETIYRSYGRAGWGGGGSADTVVREYEEGTLLVDLLQPQSGDLLWRGTAQTRLRDARTPEARDKYVKEVVGRLLAAYPPK
ncbi:MAG: DUF4136 domain-containing protein [Myxococcales bacterium]|nr:DUF4136 domain-containing protein [Myxococcales bacterium]